MVGRLVALFLIAISLLGCHSGQKGAASATSPSFHFTEAPGTPPPPPPPIYQSYLNRTPVPESGYPVIRLGADGNRGSYEEKTICIYDDRNRNYDNCGDFKTEKSCRRSALDHQGSEESRPRCVFEQGACRPQTFQDCQNILKKVPGFKRAIPFSEWIDRAVGIPGVKALATEFAHYRRLKIYYDGHGPSVEDFSQMLETILSSTDEASYVLFRSFGCSTFRSESDSLRVLSRSVDKLHTEARTRFPKMQVELQANQFTSFSFNDTDDSDRFANNSHSLLSFNSQSSPLSRFARKEAYTCSSESGAVGARHRTCLDYDLNQRAVCRREGTTNYTYETCRALSLPVGDGKTKTLLTRVLAPTTFPFEYHLLGDKNKRPIAMDTYDANRYCLAIGNEWRPADWWQTRDLLEASDALKQFTPDELRTGKVLSRTWPTTADKQEHYKRRFAYDLASLYDPRLKPHTTLSVDDKGYVFCVKTP